MLRLNYIYPNGTVITSKVDPEMQFFDAWLQSIVDSSMPGVIFFFTVDSTDIF